MRGRPTVGFHKPDRYEMVETGRTTQTRHGEVPEWALKRNGTVIATGSSRSIDHMFSEIQKRGYRVAGCNRVLA